MQIQTYSQPWKRCAVASLVLIAWMANIANAADLFDKFKRPFSNDASKPGKATNANEERQKNASYAGDLAKGRMHERVGEWDKARSVYEGMIKRFPDQPEPFHRLGVVADQQRRFGEAQQLFTDALRMRPRDPELHNDLGYCFFLQGKLEKAESSLIKAVQIDPKNSRYHNNLGLVLGHKGKHQEAFAEFAKAGSEADAYYNLAFVYSAQDNVEKAKDCFRRSLAVDPKHEAARKALQSFELFDAGGGKGLRDAEIASNGQRLVPYTENGDASSNNGSRPMVDTAVRPTAYQDAAAPRPAASNNRTSPAAARNPFERNMASKRDAGAAPSP